MGKRKSYDGICCPKCGSKYTHPVSTRRGPDVVKRRRECMRSDCGFRFNTLEALISVKISTSQGSQA